MYLLKIVPNIAGSMCHDSILIMNPDQSHVCVGKLNHCHVLDVSTSMCAHQVHIFVQSIAAYSQARFAYSSACAHKASQAHRFWRVLFENV